MKNFELRAGDKFSCIAFKSVAVDDSLAKQPLDLGGDFWALPNHPFTLDKHWREWIGKIKAEEVDRCNLFLVATKHSTRPDVLDDENQTLSRRLNRLLHGLLLQGIPDHVDGFVLTGAKVADETHIRQYGEMKQFYSSAQSPRVRFTVNSCKKAKEFEQGYASIETSRNFFRVRNGMSALSRGISEPVMQDRIHEYVRSLEALTKTEVGKSESQFIHRCQTFAVASAESRAILGESYKIRSAVEHMNLVDDIFPGRSLDEIKAVVAQRIRQIEALVFSVYFKIATSSRYAKMFETDTAIDYFWAKPDHERRSIWGTPIKISEIK